MNESTMKELMNRIETENIPMNVAFEVTYKCNLHCVHCYQESQAEADLTTDEIKFIIGQLADESCMNLVITGGEPFTRTDIFDIAEYAIAKGFLLTFLTNGTLIDKHIVLWIKALRRADLQISLYGTTAEKHDTITQCSGSYERTIETVRLLHQEGIPFHVKTPVLSLNIHEIRDIIEFCHKLGIKHYHDPMLIPTTKRNKRPLKYRLSDEDLRAYLEMDLTDVRRRKDIWRHWINQIDKMTAYKAGMCGAGRRLACISASGRVYPCNSLRLEAGNLRLADFHSIWHESPLLKKLRSLTGAEFAQCNKCRFMLLCERCPGQAYLEHGDMLKPPIEYCRFNQMIYDVITSEG